MVVAVFDHGSFHRILSIILCPTLTDLTLHRVALCGGANIRHDFKADTHASMDDFFPRRLLSDFPFRCFDGLRLIQAFWKRAHFGDAKFA